MLCQLIVNTVTAKKTCNKNYWISEVMSSEHEKPPNAQWDYWPSYGSKIF